jgi:hypothetical protein
MTFVRRVWRALTKRREPLLHFIVRRRATKRALAFDRDAMASDPHYFDKAIRAYLVLWHVAPGKEEHYRTALERFGLDEDGAGFVDQVLCSAALGTLGNWANCHDDPWWMAARHLTHSRDSFLLDPLRWSLEKYFRPTTAARTSARTS